MDFEAIRAVREQLAAYDRGVADGKEAVSEQPIRWRCGCASWDKCESPAKACQKVQRLEDALRLHMAYFEWKCAAPVEEVVAELPDRWNALMEQTEKALGLGPQERWRLE
jgi:hypothetical protein